MIALERGRPLRRFDSDGAPWFDDSSPRTERHKMAFMQRETYHGHFQLIRNTSEGDILTPEEYAQYRGNKEAAEAHGVSLDDVETVFGWSARLSAPGYLDCTDWTGVFETEEEAVAALDEMYPDDETGEEDDCDA